MTRTNREQLGRYERRLSLIRYFSAGVGGIALIATADNAALTTTHPVGGAVFLTLAVLAGGCLALSYGGYEYSNHDLKVRMENQHLAGTDTFNPAASVQKRMYNFWYVAGTILVAATGAWVAANAWWAIAHK